MTVPSSEYEESRLYFTGKRARIYLVMSEALKCTPTDNCLRKSKHAEANISPMRILSNSLATTNSKCLLGLWRGEVFHDALCDHSTEVF